MAMEKFDFNNLFVLEMANNHQGSVEHGVAIIKAMGALVRKHGARAAIKFQFRELESFVHPAHKAGSANKHVGRFLSTALNEAQFAQMALVAKKEGLFVMTTPFDEASVDMAQRLEVDILKVASCSAKDYPLLRKIAQAGLPVLASNGGLNALETGLLVELFEEAGVPFALQHCVAKYPTETHELQLRQIDNLRQWFPHLVIGFSTHERPERTDIIKMAYAKGARTFEKHVGLPTDSITLNAYSANPEQVDAWLQAWREAVVAEGDTERVVDALERTSLLELQRGVFARRSIRLGEIIGEGDIYFAFPMQNGQWSSGEFVPGLRATRAYESGEAIDRTECGSDHDVLVREVIVKARMMLNKAGAVLPKNFDWELSHHYGMRKYHETGLTMIEIVNREYCHKLLIVFPGQGNPHHYHVKKEETFRVIWGDLETEYGEEKLTLSPGDLFTVHRGVMHQFSSKAGCVFEEISTTQLSDDSFYKDESISQRPRHERKTKIAAKRR